MHLHTEVGGETVGAVVLGALLASLGGFAAGQIEARIRGLERERSAALLIGEVVNALEQIVTITLGATRRGDPFGPYTTRLLRAIHREVSTYERHRAALYDIRSPTLRIRIHALMVQAHLALDGVFETTEQLSGGAPADGPGATRRAQLAEDRDAAFAFLVEARTEMRAVVAALSAIAKVDIERLAAFAPDGAGPQAGPDAAA